MKKLLVAAIAAAVLGGVSVPASAQTQPATKHHLSNLKTAPLSDAHKVSYDKVPQKVKDTVKEHLGSTRIEDVDVGTINGKTVYEMAYKKPHNPDRTFELRVTADGHLIGVHGD